MLAWLRRGFSRSRGSHFTIGAAKEQKAASAELPLPDKRRKANPMATAASTALPLLHDGDTCAQKLPVG